MPTECSMGGFNLRKCASDKRPAVKAGTKPKGVQGSSKAKKSVQPKKKGRKGVIEDDDIPDEPAPVAEQPALRRSARQAAKKAGGKLKLKNLDPRENIKDIKGVIEGGRKKGGLKDFQTGFDQGFNHFGGVDTILKTGEILAGAGACEGGAMPSIPLKDMSPNQRSRLRNGHPVRVAMGSGAGCCSCKMKEENIKKVMRKKGGAATIKLDADEMRENKISGSGIMEGGRSVKIGKHRYGKPSIDQAKKNLGLKKGGAIGGISRAEVMSALKSGDKTVVKNYIEQQKSVAEAIGKKDPEKMTKSDAKALLRIEREMEAFQITAKEKAEKTMFQKVLTAIKKIIDDVTAALAGDDSDDNASVASTKAGNGLRYGEGGSLGYGMKGGAIGRAPTSSQITNVGAGGNILGPMQASKAPQSSSANWFFSTQFPPAMARQITG